MIFAGMETAPLFPRPGLPILWLVFVILVIRSPVAAYPYLVPGFLSFWSLHNVVEILTFQSVLSKDYSVLCAAGVMGVS